MISLAFKNSLAKVLVLLWIVCLIGISIAVAKCAIFFDINWYFGLQGAQAFGQPIVTEIQVLLLMLAVSIMGGISFMIKDFYRSIKYANLYDTVYADYHEGRIGIEEFQRLVSVEIYTGRFNHTWTYWFVIQPVLSSVLGLIAFAIARSGLGVLQGSAATTAEISIQNIYLYAVFTFLAGFSSHKFIAWLDRLADKIFSTTLPERVQEQKEMVKRAATYDRGNLKENVDPANVTANGVDSPRESDTISVEETRMTGFDTVKLETTDESYSAPEKLKKIR